MPPEYGEVQFQLETGQYPIAKKNIAYLPMYIGTSKDKAPTPRPATHLPIII
jgi:hypothetical protein